MNAPPTTDHPTQQAQAFVREAERTTNDRDVEALRTVSAERRTAAR